MALRSTLNGCWQLTHKRPHFPYINWGLGNGTVGAGRFPPHSARERSLDYPLGCQISPGQIGRRDCWSPNKLSARYPFNFCFGSVADRPVLAGVARKPAFEVSRRMSVSRALPLRSGNTASGPAAVVRYPVAIQSPRANRVISVQPCRHPEF